MRLMKYDCCQGVDTSGSRTTASITRPSTEGSNIINRKGEMQIERGLMRNNSYEQRRSCGEAEDVEIVTLQTSVDGSEREAALGE